jgi:hypothetical protein
MYSKIVCGLVLTAGAAHSAHVITRRDGDHAHAAAPAASYGAADPPAPAYGAPEPSYAEPAYAPPQTGYGVSYEEEAPFDISTLIIPILVIAGLSLLFPTIINVDANSTGRKRRDIDTSSDVIDRVNEIYTAVVQSEECMEKIACEVGALAGDVGLTRSPALKLAGGFMPKKYKTYYSQFISGKDCNKIKCGTFA